MSHERIVRTIRVIEENDDGSTDQIDFEELPVPSNDPHVRSRLGDLRDGRSSEIITEFEAAPERPPTYPRGMPFLSNRAVWTTESPDGSHSTGARWRCADPDAVIADVIAMSGADGWLPAPAPPALGLSPDAVVLHCPGRMRVLTKYEAYDVRIVELMELSDDWFDA